LIKRFGIQGLRRRFFAGLRALEERDDAVEKWLRNEVVSSYDALDADPKRSIPAARVFAELRVRHRARTSSPRTAPSRLHETR